MEQGEGERRKMGKRGGEAHIHGGERYLISLDISLSLQDVVALQCHEVLVVLGMGPALPEPQHRKGEGKEDKRKHGERVNKGTLVI